MSPEPRPDSLLPLPPAVFHILMAIADEDRHGYGIIQEVAARTNGEVRLSAGHALPLHPANAGRRPDRRDAASGRRQSWTMSGGAITAITPFGQRGGARPKLRG